MPCTAQEPDQSSVLYTVQSSVFPSRPLLTVCFILERSTWIQKIREPRVEDAGTELTSQLYHLSELGHNALWGPVPTLNQLTGYYTRSLFLV